MKRLTDLKLVVRLGRRIGGIRSGSSGFVYSLSGLGYNVIAETSSTPVARRRVYDTSPGHSDHLLMIADVYISAVEAERRNEIELLDFQAEPPCWRRFAGIGGQQITLKPDGFIRLGVDEMEISAFLEVDLGTESAPTLSRRCLAYAAYWKSGAEQHQHGVFPLVLWATPTAKRVGQIEQVIKRLPTDARPLFLVTLLDDWLAALTLGGGDEA